MGQSFLPPPMAPSLFSLARAAIPAIEPTGCGDPENPFGVFIKAADQARRKPVSCGIVHDLLQGSRRLVDTAQARAGGEPQLAGAIFLNLIDETLARGCRFREQMQFAMLKINLIEAGASRPDDARGVFKKTEDGGALLRREDFETSTGRRILAVRKTDQAAVHADPKIAVTILQQSLGSSVGQALRVLRVVSIPERRSPIPVDGGEAARRPDPKHALSTFGERQRIAAAEIVGPAGSVTVHGELIQRTVDLGNPGTGGDPKHAGAIFADVLDLIGGQSVRVAEKGPLIGIGARLGIEKSEAAVGGEKELPGATFPERQKRLAVSGIAGVMRVTHEGVPRRVVALQRAVSSADPECAFPIFAEHADFRMT